ncbi:putative calcium-binding protein [Sesamum angolense]|uniref:Calcium-binding protein n=1 Tax=Sesamum angolense TaxID=2727404 RepID=A0AAE1X228_9LAMI|nr:putative calcium-binding protein [Sesamum angolense]
MGRNSRTIKRVSRIGSYAIASSITDPTCVSCTTFNILAPIYKRLSQEDPSYRESDVKGFWLNRNKRILDWLLCERASIICLQVYKILQYVESYQYENKLNPLPILLCGDWNGSKSGHVYKFLRSQGFISSYDAAHVVSHRNHRGNICGVDFIWLLNPNRYRKLLKTSWSEALAGMLKHQLKRVSLTEDDAFAFLKADSEGDYITYFGFYEALQQLNLVGHCHGLCNEEVKELWLQADVDRNGVIDYKEFKQQIWNTYSDQGERERDNIWETSSMAQYKPSDSVSRTQFSSQQKSRKECGLKITLFLIMPVSQWSFHHMTKQEIVRSPDDALEGQPCKLKTDDLVSMSLMWYQSPSGSEILGEIRNLAGDLAMMITKIWILGLGSRFMGPGPRGDVVISLAQDQFGRPALALLILIGRPKNPPPSQAHDPSVPDPVTS